MEGALKLIIQIPCYNEEGTLAVALADLPRQIEGFDEVEWLIIDDGSTDKTVDVARRNGVDHIVSFATNQGLAKGFMAGMQASLSLGADVIVNTDADNQYDASCIPELVKPILDGKAKIVVGARPIETIEHFSPVKKFLQRVGSSLVAKISRTAVRDAPSGFRAIHRDAALRMRVFNPYTYTLETIIQAGRNNIPIASVPVNVNDDLRPSRLVKSIPDYLRRSLITMFRIYVLYEPLRFFSYCAAVMFVPGMLIAIRFLYYYSIGEGAGHIQSLLFAAVCVIASGLLMVAGTIADVVSANRVLLEDINTRLLSMNLDAQIGVRRSGAAPSGSLQYRIESCRSEASPVSTTNQ
jgi:glycosyltransferase involved in cell wall biosynthesis